MSSHGHGQDHGADNKGGAVKDVHREHDFVERLYVPAIASGMAVTIRHFFTNLFSKEKYTATIQYPDVKTPYPSRFRGMHRLVPREDELRCIFCGFCVEACPCDAIRMDTGFHPPPVQQRGTAQVGRADLLAFFGKGEQGTRMGAHPPPTAGGQGRIDRSEGDHGAGGARGGF